MAIMATEHTLGQQFNKLPVGKFLKLHKVIPSGSLEVRKLANGEGQLYWRYTMSGKTQRVTIGIYDSSAPPKSLAPTARGYSLAAANRAAEVLSEEHNNHEGGRPALLADKAREQAEALAREQAILAAKEAARKFTLKHLLSDYCDYLKSLGRTSHANAQSIFNLHVVGAWPKVAALPANQVTAEQVADMMRKLLEAGKGRTANKLRSYVRAAYETARAARTKASIPLKFKAYAIVHNPGADTSPDDSQNKADKNPLSAAELKSYWKCIRKIEGFKGAVLRLHLLTGGQRIEQLARLLTADISDGYITLMDGKGRPGKPARAYSVPLVPLATEALNECRPVGVYALSTRGGKVPIAGTTLSGWAAEAAAPIAEFQTKRVRSGVETFLASKGVSDDVRARLQSHGLSGVQNRHYNAYEYLNEKRDALKLLEKFLIEKPRNVASEIQQKTSI